MSDIKGFPNKFINQYSAIDSIISFIDDLKSLSRGDILKYLL